MATAQLREVYYDTEDGIGKNKNEAIVTKDLTNEERIAVLKVKGDFNAQVKMVAQSFVEPDFTEVAKLKSEFKGTRQPEFSQKVNEALGKMYGASVVVERTTPTVITEKDGKMGKLKLAQDRILMTGFEDEKFKEAIDSGCKSVKVLTKVTELPYHLKHDLSEAGYYPAKGQEKKDILNKVVNDYVDDVMNGVERQAPEKKEPEVEAPGQ